MKEVHMQGSAFITALCPTGGSRAAVLPSAVTTARRCGSSWEQQGAGICISWNAPEAHFADW